MLISEKWRVTLAKKEEKESNGQCKTKNQKHYTHENNSKNIR